MCNIFCNIHCPSPTTGSGEGCYTTIFILIYRIQLLSPKEVANIFYLLSTTTLEKFVHTSLNTKRSLRNL